MFRLNRKKEEGMPQVRGQPSNDGCKEEEDAKVPCSAGASGVDAQQLPPTRKKRSLMKRLSSNLSLLPRKHHKRKTSVPNPPSPTTNPASAAWEDAKRSELGTSSSSLFSSLRSKTTDSLCSKNFLSSGLDSSCMGNKQSRAPLGASAEEGDEVAKKGAVGGARVRLSSAPSASQDKPDDAVDEMPEDAIGSAENAVEAPVTLDFETTLRKGMLNLTVNDVEEADSDRPNTDEDNKSSDRDYAVTPTTPGMFSQDGGSGSEEPSLAPAGPAPNKHILRRAHIIKELLETERNYVKDLGLVVDGYMGQMRDPNCDTPMPEDLRGGKDKIVFGNLEAIYEWHRNSFLKSLELCADEPMKIGPLFQRCEHKLRLYVVYCENKNKSEYIVSEYLETYFEELRQKLGHKLQLPDLLIKPVQRITKYQLLLKDLYDITEKAGLSEEAKILRKAVDLMRVIPKEANDMMLIGRIQGFDGRITAQGKLLHSGTLICQEGTSASSLSKPKDLEVFLFEQSMIFSEQTGKKTQFTLPGFVYRNHLKVNNMALVEKWGDDPLKFSVKSTDSRKELVYVCQVQTLEIREVWATKIRTMLDLQRNFLMALQSPIVYQKELTLKDS